MKKKNISKNQNTEELAAFCWDLLENGDENQLAASSTEGLSAIFTTALMGARCPACGADAKQQKVVRLVHHVLSVVRGEAPRRLV